MAADDSLPPLEEMPDAVLAPSQTAHAADWAATFGGSDTNLAQRQRHNADILAYTKSIQDQKAAQLQNDLQTNQVAQNLWFRQQDLARKEQTSADSLAQRAAQFQQQQALREASANSVNAVRDLTVRHQLAQQQDLTNFSKKVGDVMDQGYGPGTSEYRDAVISASIAHPNADPRVVTNAYKAARIKETPQDVLNVWNSIPPEQRSVTQFTTTADGTLAFKARNVTPEELQRQTVAEQNAATARTREQRLQQVHEAKMRDLGIPTAPAAAPVAVPASPALPVVPPTDMSTIPTDTSPALNTSAAPSSVQEKTVVNPKTGERLALRNGQWVPLK